MAHMLAVMNKTRGWQKYTALECTGASWILGKFSYLSYTCVCLSQNLCMILKWITDCFTGV